METSERKKYSTFKTRITLEEIKSFLYEKYPKDISNLAYIKSGESYEIDNTIPSKFKEIIMFTSDYLR